MTTQGYKTAQSRVETVGEKLIDPELHGGRRVPERGDRV
jgi:hypothetical protein